MNITLEITAVAALLALEGALTIDNHISRLESRRALSYIYTNSGSECPFGLGVNVRRPPSCVRGAPTVLKGAGPAVRTGDTRESTRLGTGVAVEGTAGAAMIPDVTACCTDGTSVSMGTEVVSGTSSGATGVWRSTSRDSESVPR